MPAGAARGVFQSRVDLTDDAAAPEEPPTPAENVDALIDAGTEEGLIHEEDRELIQSVVEFGDKVVREVMTPRPKIVAIAGGRSIRELVHHIPEDKHRHLTVVQAMGSVDSNVGSEDALELGRVLAKARNAGLTTSLDMASP